MPEPKIEVPSYEDAKQLTIELRVVGTDGAALPIALGVPLCDMTFQEARVIAQVRPFASMTEEEYTKWVADLLRHKLSEHWWVRW